MSGDTYYVYSLIDPRNGEMFYIGKGKGVRLYAHKTDALRENFPNKPHHDRILDIVRNGLEIVYVKLLVKATEFVALEKEQQLIESVGRVNQGTGPLLNITAGGQAGSSAHAKPITQYTLDGELVQHWTSAKTAGEQTAANRAYITQVCKGKRKSAGGFMWTYKGDPKPTMHKRYWKEVQQFSLDGYLMETYQSLTEAQQKTGVELHNISECCRGNSKTAGGFMWIPTKP